MRFLLIDGVVAVGSTVAGMVLALVLHLAGMPVPLIVITVMLVSSAAVLLDWRRGHGAQDEAVDTEEVLA